MYFINNRIKLDDFVSKWIPEMGKEKMKVFVSIKDGNPVLEELKKEITINDLLTHTSGITYGMFGNSYSDRVLKDLLGPEKIDLW